MNKFHLLNQALESKKPVWSALNGVYNSVDGDLQRKSLEVSELVGKFVLHQLITGTQIGDLEIARREAGKMISEINEYYPFNTQTALLNVMTGLKTYSKLITTPNSLGDLDDVLTALIRGGKLEPAPATESLKDKVVGFIKSVVGKDKDDKGDEDDEKSKKDAQSKKAPAKDKANKVDAGNEDGDPSADAPEPDDQPMTDPAAGTESEDVEINVNSASASVEIEIQPPSDGKEVEGPEPDTDRINAHEVAWEVLTLHFREGEQ